jgi:multisubunit Na+/H+ antiporter MnhC subunit
LPGVRQAPDAIFIKEWKMGFIVFLAVAAVIAVLLVCCIRHIKKKIRNKIIDTGANIITKAAGNIVDEKTASKVNEVTNIAAEIAKGGKPALIMTAKKVLEITKDKELSLEKIKGKQTLTADTDH